MQQEEETKEDEDEKDEVGEQKTNREREGEKEEKLKRIRTQLTRFELSRGSALYAKLPLYFPCDITKEEPCREPCSFSLILLTFSLQELK